MTNHKDLTVWKESVELAVTCYKITEGFPRLEQHGLASQMRRAAISIASNIAEGAARTSIKEFIQFLWYRKLWWTCGTPPVVIPLKPGPAVTFAPISLHYANHNSYYPYTPLTGAPGGPPNRTLRQHKEEKKSQSSSRGTSFIFTTDPRP